MLLSISPNIFNNVDLPDPEAPVIETNSPSFISNDIFFNAVIYLINL